MSTTPAALAEGRRTVAVLHWSAADRSMLQEFLAGLGAAVLAPPPRTAEPSLWPPISLVICDEGVAGQHLPALLRLKEARAPLYLPVLVLARSEASALRWLGQGCDDALVYPLRKGLLRARITALLKLHETSVELARRTRELQLLVDTMAGREIRMAELKEVIKTLRHQLEDAGIEPEADDPLLGNNQ